MCVSEGVFLRTSLLRCVRVRQSDHGPPMHKFMYSCRFFIILQNDYKTIQNATKLTSQISIFERFDRLGVNLCRKRKKDDSIYGTEDVFMPSSKRI